MTRSRPFAGSVVTLARLDPSPCGRGILDRPRAACGTRPAVEDWTEHLYAAMSEARGRVSEDLVARKAQPFGRLSYLSLGATTLGQLKKSRFIRSALPPEATQRKPDGIVFLPMGGIKAVIEVKQPRELTSSKLPSVVERYAPIAAAVCNLLILTDGKKSFWFNAHTKRPVIGQDGKPVRRVFDPAAASSGDLDQQTVSELLALIELAEHSLTPDNDALLPRAVIDPTNLAKKVWQKIWVNTGKEPEKCLYNVVEILVFKFLSDTGVLTGPYSFKHVVELLAGQGPRTALVACRA